MKSLYTYLALSLVVLLTSCSATNYAQDYVPESPGITYQQFYDDLSPYGNWVDYPNYGYAWVPYEQGFRPYYNNGHWVYTNYGWTWVSNYSWGWAPFHYGRWLYDDFYGWLWIPGYEWAPAWVSWRNGDDCYGWAPLGPGGSFNISIGSRIPYNYWTFVPRRYINSPRINNYYINREKNVTIINNTTVINNTNITQNKTVYVVGPSATEVEKVTNEKIRPVRIVQKNTPGNTNLSGSTVSIYKPAVRETPQQNQQLKPSKIVNLNELKLRRENAGNLQNENAKKEVQGRPAPVDTRTQSAINPQKINPVNEKPDQVIEKRNQVIEKPNPVNEKPAQVIEKRNPVIENPNPVVEKPNPVVERRVQVQPPQKVTPEQRRPDFKPENINRERNNNPPTQNNNNQQPVEVNKQPARVRVIDQPNNNSEKVRQMVPPTPVNRQPVKQQPNNPVMRPQQLPSQDNKQLNRQPVNRTPIIRDQNQGEPRGNGNIREVPQKEKNKF
jgi:hypothetical protein